VQLDGSELWWWWWGGGGQYILKEQRRTRVEDGRNYKLKIKEKSLEVSKQDTETTSYADSGILLTVLNV
jgi:hypothetical protein